MKAKQYAEKFLNEISEIQKNNKNLDVMTEEVNNAAVRILHEFVQEVKELVFSRNSTSDSCLLGVFKQQSDKWRAFSIRVNKELPYPILKEDGFKEYVIFRIPHLEGKI